MSGKKSVLVTSKILRLFINTITADDRKSLLNRGNLTQPIQIVISEKEKKNSEFFDSFFMLLRNYGLPRTCLDNCLISTVSDNPIDKQHDERPQTRLKSKRQHLCHIYWSLWRQLSRKKSFLVLCKKLRLFVNTLTADDKYSLHNRENLMQAVQMPLSQKEKRILSIFFCITFTVINKNSKGAVVQIATVLWPIYHLACQRVLWNETF